MSQAIQYEDLVIPIRTRNSRADNQFVPVCFSRMPDDALSDIPLYMRSTSATGASKFTLYAGAGVKFTPEHRERLQRLGISFIHILAEDQPKLRRKLEERIENLADDSAIELSVRCEIIYESGLELIDEALSARNSKIAVNRLQRVTRSIVKLYEEGPATFAHFFAAARHDSCASTHAANAAVWLPPLAMKLGESRPEALANLALGAMLYDIGMSSVPVTVLSQPRKLNNTEIQQVRQHPELGAQFLRQMADIDPSLVLMALQHHERLDGSGYPRHLTFDSISEIARMAAVVDTFDALTSFRPYRAQGISPPAAIDLLQKESPHRYDPRIVKAWTHLLRDAFPDMMTAEQKTSIPTDITHGRRRFERYSTNCPAVLGTLALVSGIWTEKLAMKAIAYNLSRGGLGIRTQTRLTPGDYFRIKLQAKDNAARVLNGVVVRISPKEDGWFEIGARFVDLAQEVEPLAKHDMPAPKPLAPIAPAPSAPAPEIEGEFLSPEIEGSFVAP